MTEAQIDAAVRKITEAIRAQDEALGAETVDIFRGWQQRRAERGDGFPTLREYLKEQGYWIEAEWLFRDMD